jgi:hypothetical protein
LRLIGRLALDALRAFRAALAEFGRDSRAALRAAARGRAGVGFPASWRQVPRGRAGATPARRRLLSARGRALRSFRALATWAARQGLAYREHLGALVYAREIARKLPDRGGSVQAAAQLLERILYSARQAAPEELSALERAVRCAIRGR